ncbi:MAG: acyl-CoA synthetase [Polyangiaceae bacterium]|nr:acyl-CoA synthetase [Polyangiaceae bacterium]
MSHLGFWKLAAERPDDTALVDAKGRAQTAGALLARVNRLSHGLRARGVRRGDSVAVVLKNEAAVVELFMATAQIGVYYTPINVNLAAPEIAYILGDSEARLVVASPAVAGVVAAAADEAGLTAAQRFATGDVPGFAPFEALLLGQPDGAPADRVAGAPMSYTSGTTGKPKGVRRPIADVAPEVTATMQAMFLGLFGITPRDGVHLVVSPLYHTAVLNFCTNHLHNGHAVVLMDKWTPEGMLELVAKHKVTATHMVPTQFRRLLALPAEERARHDVSSFRHAIHSAAPCPVDVKQAMLDWWGSSIWEYYAASEGGGTVASPDDWRAHPGTVGKAWPISRIEVRKDDGSVCAPREVGTVYMSMGAHRFEYHKDQEKTASSWSGDFFTVGDAGYLDEEGFLYLVDRKSDMIISGGVNIYPAEIEAALLAHPKVLDAAVFGVPNDDWGEEIKAVVEPAPGAEPGAALAGELTAFLAERIARFKVPKSIDFTSEMPRDPNGKLYKRKLRDPYWAGRSRAI